jgi:hypothetical protein
MLMRDREVRQAAVVVTLPGAGTVAAAITDLVRASYRQIARWQARLGELRRHADPAADPDLAATWDTVAALIDLHMRAGEEVRGPAICRAAPHGAALEREIRDAHADHGPAAVWLRRADPGLRQLLARQWRAFQEARIRDLYPDAPPRLTTCELRLARPATPRLAAPAFGPLSCTCQACTARLSQIRSASVPAPAAAAQRPEEH